MLVNVKFFKKTFLISFFLSITTSLFASEKDQIVAQLNSLSSLEFTFDQSINEKTEKGSCLLEFPGKLKCNYFDDKKKELVINKKNESENIFLKNFTFTNMICLTNNTFFFHHINNSSSSIVSDL